MTENEIKDASRTFRKALEKAKNGGLFASDVNFSSFPSRCCRDTCYLLAEYLKHHNIITITYYASRNDWTHDWLVVADNRINNPAPDCFYWPNELQPIVASYGAKNSSQPVNLTRYKETDFVNGLIIDITGDQFDDCSDSVYVGPIDRFHSSFEFRSALLNEEPLSDRLNRIYYLVLQSMN